LPVSDEGQVALLLEVTLNVSWGDGTQTSASVTQTASGLYEVMGQHLYQADGTYAATVAVTDAAGVVTSTGASVAAGDVYAGISSTLTLTSFSDTNPNASAGEYTVNIVWGDGASSAGTVTQVGSTFVVTGSHSYASPGTDNVGVTVTNQDGGHLTTTVPVAVLQRALNLTAGNIASPALTVSGEVASFTDPNLTDQASQFNASINWGDGTQTSGTVQGSKGLFQVLGSHTYTNAGSFPLAINVA
jgi:hypothetical protein